uniref:Uncharacterized protein n=1 Tax=Anguilla anguilla TaxID=7936 RepID=A0A0E9S1N9_ANGAN
MRWDDPTLPSSSDLIIPSC